METATPAPRILLIAADGDGNPPRAQRTAILSPGRPGLPEQPKTRLVGR
jgi:hypothetical protein